MGEPLDKTKGRTNTKSFFTENDPTMRLTKTGLKYDDESVLAPNQHSRNTYEKLMKEQLHQASNMVLDRSRETTLMGGAAESGTLDGLGQQIREQPINEQAMARRSFVNGQQSGTFISVQAAAKEDQKNLGMQSGAPLGSYEFGFRGAAGSKTGLPHTNILGSMTQSGFLEDSASEHVSRQLFAVT